MAKTAKGMVGDCEELSQILYVSQDRLQALTKKFKNAKTAGTITKKEVHELMFPEDDDDEKVLVPIDIELAGKDFPVAADEMVEKVGPAGAMEAIIQAAEHFKKTSATKFPAADRPIPMSVGEWLAQAEEDEEDEADDEGEEEGDMEDEEEEEDEAEEEDGGDEEEPPAKKSRKL